jgi:hypothetical protein
MQRAKLEMEIKNNEMVGETHPASSMKIKK